MNGYVIVKQAVFVVYISIVLRFEQTQREISKKNSVSLQDVQLHGYEHWKQGNSNIWLNIIFLNSFIFCMSNSWVLNELKIYHLLPFNRVSSPPQVLFWWAHQNFSMIFYRSKMGWCLMTNLHDGTINNSSVLHKVWNQGSVVRCP